jgi:hypothetical protein
MTEIVLFQHARGPTGGVRSMAATLGYAEAERLVTERMLAFLARV